MKMRQIQIVSHINPHKTNTKHFFNALNSLTMKTLKAKFIFFSLSAIIAALFLSSCEQSELVEISEPISNEATVLSDGAKLSDRSRGDVVLLSAMNDKVIFEAILEASKGKFTAGNLNGRYNATLTRQDLGRVVYSALMEAESLTIEETLTISAADAEEIFCIPNIPCLSGVPYTFQPFEVEIVGFASSTINSLCFELRPNYWVCVV